MSSYIILGIINKVFFSEKCIIVYIMHFLRKIRVLDSGCK